MEVGLFGFFCFSSELWIVYPFNFFQKSCSLFIMFGFLCGYIACLILLNNTCRVRWGNWWALIDMAECTYNYPTLHILLLWTYLIACNPCEIYDSDVYPYK